MEALIVVNIVITVAVLYGLYRLWGKPVSPEATETAHGIRALLEQRKSDDERRDRLASQIREFRSAGGGRALLRERLARRQGDR